MPTFVDLLNDSQSSRIQEPTMGLDNASMFLPEAASAVRGKQTSFGQGLNCDGHSKVFMLWKPWTKCYRCMKAVEHGEIVPPEIGDYACPHTMNKEFEDLLNQGLQGNVLFQTQEYFNLQNGERCCHMVWLSLNSNANALAAKKQEVAETFSPLHSTLIAEQKELAEKDLERKELEQQKEALEASEEEEIG